MYKFDNGQISLEDFGQPVGMNLKNSNRWVKRAQTIPWIEIEKKYAKLFSNKKGNVAKSLRLGLGARIIHISSPLPILYKKQEKYRNMRFVSGHKKQATSS